MFLSCKQKCTHYGAKCFVLVSLGLSTNCLESNSDRNLQGKKKWKSTVLLLSLHQKFMCWLSFSVTHNYLRIMWCIVFFLVNMWCIVWSFNLMISCSWNLCIIPMALLSNVRYRWKFVNQFLFYNSWCGWNRHSYD